MLADIVELRHLRYFIAVAEAENVSRAALKLHLSQPALSRQVRDLEDELGFPLFERGPKSVRLTGAGKTFHSEARAVLDRLDQALKTARAAAGGRLDLHVGYAPSLTARLLPRTLRAFQTVSPGSRVLLHDLSTGEMLAGLRDGALQIALLARPAPAALRGLRFEAIARDSFCVAVSPKHRLARRRAANLADLAGEPLFAYSRQEYPEYLKSLERLFASVEAKPRVVEEHDGVSSLIAAVEAGGGVAVVTESVACLSGPRLKFIPLSPAPEPLVIGAAWAASGLSAAAEQFLQSARQAASEGGKN